MTLYQDRIASRSWLRFIVGFLVRLKKYLYYAFTKKVAQNNGASICENVTMHLSFAKKLNSLVTIGDNVSINKECDITDIVYPISIGNNVIIGNNVSFLLTSHNIDSPEWEHIQSSKGLVIEDYVWICPHSIILPSVKRIRYGSVIGAGSVVAKDTKCLEVVGGNPSTHLRYRKCVHSHLVVESLLGGDLVKYVDAYKKSRKIK